MVAKTHEAKPDEVTYPIPGSDEDLFNIAREAIGKGVKKLIERGGQHIDPIDILSKTMTQMVIDNEAARENNNGTRN